LLEELEDFMTIEFDENGKFYTDIISKIPIHVVIQTVTHRINGLIHIRQGFRLKDELDLPEKFIAITDAIMCMPDGQIIDRANFLAVHRDEIIWVMPDEKVLDPPKETTK
jgi:hypothetical protein